MAEQVPNTGTTTIIERRSGAGTVILGLVLLIAVAIGGFYLINRSNNDNIRTDAVASAAKDVGDSARKIGESAEKAADKVAD